MRHIVANAFEDSVRIFAGEFMGMGCAIRGRAIEITGNGDRGYSNNGSIVKLPFRIVVLRMAGSQAQPPAVIMDHDADVIQIVEERCGAIERGIIEVPFRRTVLPDELCKSVLSGHAGARRLQGCGPPQEIVDHRRGGRLELRQSSVDIAALVVSPQGGDRDVDR